MRAMRRQNDGTDLAGTARRAWAELVGEVLPAAARSRGWPVTTPSGFERVLLDHVLGAPWETVIGRPSARTAGALDLIFALEMGERVREGSACLSEMNRRSLALRAPRTGAPRDRGPTRDAGDPDVSALLRRAMRSQARARGRAS